MRESLSKTGTVVAEGRAYECIPFVIDDYWEARKNE
jgi:hypothetical protein